MIRNNNSQRIIYRLPFPENVPVRISRPVGIFSHERYPETRYAIDFFADIGTPVLAARSGKVWNIKMDSSQWGPDLALANEVNFVTINHGDGTYAEYLHLAKDSVAVSLGEDVPLGAILGYTGLSGCMDAPHLHFNVFTVEDGKAKSVPVEIEQ